MLSDHCDGKWSYAADELLFGRGYKKNVLEESSAIGRVLYGYNLLMRSCAAGSILLYEEDAKVIFWELLAI